MSEARSQAPFFQRTAREAALRGAVVGAALRFNQCGRRHSGDLSMCVIHLQRLAEATDALELFLAGQARPAGTEGGMP